MSISEKKKKAAFHRCLHDLKKETEYFCPEDFLRSNRDRLFKLLSVETESLEKFEKRLGDALKLMQELYYTCYMEWKLDDYSKYTEEFWINKYEFYGMIARAADEFIEQYGDSSETTRELTLFILDKVQDFIESWKTTVAQDEEIFKKGVERYINLERTKESNDEF